MALNLTVASEGGFTPYLKYNAKAGRWFVKGENGDVEIVNPRIAVDLENARSGWLCFPQGSAPIAVWDGANGVRPPKPEPALGASFKEGFEVIVFGPDKQPGLGGQSIGVREWSANANAAKDAIIMMNQEYLNQKAANPGMIPIFQATGITGNESQFGTNYTPTMTLTGWVERAKIPQFDELLAQRVTAPVAAPPSNGAGDWQAPHENVQAALDAFPGAEVVPNSMEDDLMGGGDFDDAIPFLPETR